MSAYNFIKSVRILMSIILVLVFSACETTEEASSKYDGRWLSSGGDLRLTISANATKVIVEEIILPKAKGISQFTSHGPFTLRNEGSYTSGSFEKITVVNYDQLSVDDQNAIPKFILIKIDGEYMVIRDSNSSYDDAYNSLSEKMLMKI